MKNPVTIRMSDQEVKVLKKITKTKKVSEAIRKLIFEEMERQGQMALGEKIYGKMKSSDFDARLI